MSKIKWRNEKFFLGSSNEFFFHNDDIPKKWRILLKNGDVKYMDDKIRP